MTNNKQNKFMGKKGVQFILNKVADMISNHSHDTLHQYNFGRFPINPDSDTITWMDTIIPDVFNSIIQQIPKNQTFIGQFTGTCIHYVTGSIYHDYVGSYASIFVYSYDASSTLVEYKYNLGHIHRYVYNSEYTSIS